MRTDDRGETMVELLLAVVIMGLVIVAAVGGLVTAVLVSDIHRKQATAASYARDYAEAVQAAPYVACATPPAYASAGPTWPGYPKSVVAVRYWTGSAWQGSCSADVGVQQVTVQVASADGRAAEKVVVVLRKPCGPGSSC
jgi:type II secretory pathway pseudopilin PulG